MCNSISLQEGFHLLVLCLYNIQVLVTKMQVNQLRKLKDTYHNVAQRFSTWSLLKFWPGWFLILEGYPVYYGIFSSIPISTHYVPVATLTSSCDNQKCLQTLPVSSGESKSPPDCEPLCYSNSDILASLQERPGRCDLNPWCSNIFITHLDQMSLFHTHTQNKNKKITKNRTMFILCFSLWSGEVNR